MNNVTRERTIHRGRPRKFSSPAERQKAYRERKNQQTGFQIGTPVSHRKHGNGIITGLLSEIRAYVAIPGPPRCWFDLPVSELTIIGKNRKVPAWANPEIRHTKKPVSFCELKFPEKNSELATFYGVKIRDIPVYYKKQKGARRKGRDFTKVINDTLARFVAAAKGEAYEDLEDRN